MDLSPAFITSDTAHLPTATTVFDHFHLIKLFNKVFMPLGMNVAAAPWEPHGERSTSDCVQLRQQGDDWLSETVSILGTFAARCALKNDAIPAQYGWRQGNVDDTRYLFRLACHVH
ncbi:transposase [Desulfofustis glycolicus]|uniref:transposase n=1 Tax=Desulfofustis glycolicus TaxID=51195 RepID=UPI0009344AE9|nr:transposase [Desulfofustis glycolicus]